MKRNFISTLLSILGSLDQVLPDLMIRESMHYKDLRLQGFDPNKIYIGMNNLKKRGLLISHGKDYKFTEKGLAWMRGSYVKYVTLPRIKWDRRWRVVIFDIPKELHQNRIIFRKKLVSLGFFPLQKSVYAFPCKCEEELGYICEKLEINDFVDVITAESLGFKEEEVKKFFNLK